LWLRTNLGLGYDNNTENSSSLVVDAGFDVIINDKWKINFFYFNDQSNANQLGTPQQGGGVGLKFRQDFNSRKDFAESWKPKGQKGESRREKGIKR